MSQTWYVRDGRRIDGPFTLAELRQAASSGNIRPDTLVSESRTGGWVAARHIARLPFGGQATTPERLARVVSDRRRAPRSLRINRRAVAIGTTGLLALLLTIAVWRREEPVLVGQTPKAVSQTTPPNERLVETPSLKAKAKSLPAGVDTQRWRRKLRATP